MDGKRNLPTAAQGGRVVSMRRSPSSMSDFGRKMIAMDADRPIPSMTATEARVALAEADQAMSYYLSRDECSREAEKLIRMWPRPPETDLTVFALAIMDCFLDYPATCVRAVTNARHGLPSRLKFFPSLAEIVEALNGELNRLTATAADLRTIATKAETASARTVGAFVADTVAGAETLRDAPSGPFSSRGFHRRRRASSLEAAGRTPGKPGQSIGAAAAALLADKGGSE